MKKISCLILALSLVVMYANVALAKKKKKIEKNHNTNVQKVMIEQRYHHLGDNTLPGWIVPEPEGNLWEKTFRIEKSTLNKYQISFVKFLCHGLYDTDFIVNGHHIVLDPSDEQSDQHFVNYAIPLPKHFFYPGNNTIGFKVIKDLNDNYDDMEFGELEIWFQKEEGGDDDGDGIPNDDDVCPDSDLSATVVTDGCNSEVENTLFNNGCTIADHIMECAETSSNHGKFIKCIAHFTNKLKKRKDITGKEKGAIKSCAAKADIP